MAVVQIKCAYCGKLSFKEAGGVNRARRSGLGLYCNRTCSGLGRRTDTRTKRQKVADKAVYDAEYRAKNRQMLKAKKADYFQRTYDSAKAAIERKQRMPRHVEYCRQPEYRAWKKSYDRQYRAKKSYGDFADCFLLVMDIRDECLRQMSDYEIRVSKGTINKRQQRKRDYERSLREEPQVGPLGNLELGQGWKNGGLASGLRSIAGSRNSANHEYSVASVAAGKASGRSGSHHVRGKLNADAILQSREASHG